MANAFQRVIINLSLKNVSAAILQGFDAPRRPSQAGDIETGTPPPPPPVNEEKDRYMDEFFKEVSSIKASP